MRGSLWGSQSLVCCFPSSVLCQGQRDDRKSVREPVPCLLFSFFSSLPSCWVICRDFFFLFTPFLPALAFSELDEWMLYWELPGCLLFRSGFTGVRGFCVIAVVPSVWVFSCPWDCEGCCMGRFSSCPWLLKNRRTQVHLWKFEAISTTKLHNSVQST